MQLKIRHATQYHYSLPASYALLKVRMRPPISPVQSVRSWDMVLKGAVAEASYRDPHGNGVDLVALDPAVNKVDICVCGEVETLSASGVSGRHCAPMPLWFYRRQTPLTRAGKGVTALLEDIGDIRAEPIAGLHRLSARIRERVAYMPGATHVSTRAEEAMKLRQGVCQDHSHIFLAAVRQLGFSARYVSGYLMMDDRIDQDASHAWAEVHLDGLGWVGFDVSNGLSPDERYVHLSYGLDYRDAAPTSGIVIGAQDETMQVSIQVQQ